MAGKPVPRPTAGPAPAPKPVPVPVAIPRQSIKRGKRTEEAAEGERAEEEDLLPDASALTDLEGRDDDELRGVLDPLDLREPGLFETRSHAVGGGARRYYLIAEAGIARCWYDEPLRSHGGATTRADFLRAVALWLETDRRDFLREPSVRAYLRDECDWQDPIVTQAGFVKRINSVLQSVGLQERAKSTFVDLCEHVALVWGTHSMPLDSLFSDGMRIAWAAKGCMHGISADSWCVDAAVLGRSTRAILTGAKRKRWENLDQRERILVLSDKVNVNWAHVLQHLDAERKNGEKEAG